MICRYCLTPLSPEGRKDRKYCDKECAQAAAKEKWRKANPKTAESVIATGAIAEINQLRAISHLLKHGYLVYRALYAGMPCALIAVDTLLGNMIRVEVVSGSYTPGGALTHAKRDASKFDMLLVVTPKDVHVRPS